MKKVILIFFIVGLVVFGNALFNKFVWDDEEQVVNNGLIHSISNFPQFFGGSTFNTGGSGNLGGLYYKPLMTVSFSLLSTLFGANPFFFHLFQIILHILNSFFVYLIFKKFFPKTSEIGRLSLPLIPTALSLVFLVHPINSETVVYISSLQDILYFFFGSLAFLLLLYKDHSSKNFSFISLLLLLSLLSKETGVVFIFICYLYLSIFNKDRFKTFFVWPVFSLAVYLFLRFLIAGVYLEKHNLSPITRANFFERLPSIPKIFWRYIETFLFPKNLITSQQWMVTSINFKDFFLPVFFSTLAVASILLIPLLNLRTKNRDIFKTSIFFTVWFFAALGLHLQIFPLDMTYADRWFYLPMVGLLGLIGVLFTKLRIKNEKLKVFLLISFILVISVLSIRTIIRNTNWKDGFTLYTHDIKYAPESFDLQNNLGVELYRAGKNNEAKIHFQKSTELAPFWWTNWSNLGVIYEVEGEATKAAELYQKAIDSGDYYLAHVNRTKLMLNYFGPEKGKKAAEESLKKLPNNSDLWLSLALSEYLLSDKLPCSKQVQSQDPSATSSADPKCLEEFRKSREISLTAARNSYFLSPNEQNYYVITRLEQGLDLEFKPKN